MISRRFFAVLMLAAVCQGALSKCHMRHQRHAPQVSDSELEKLIRSLIVALEERTTTPSPVTTPKAVTTPSWEGETSTMSKEVTSTTSEEATTTETPVVPLNDEATAATDASVTPEAQVVVDDDEEAVPKVRAIPSTSFVNTNHGTTMMRISPMWGGGGSPINSFLNINPSSIRFVRSGPVQFDEEGRMSIPTSMTFNLKDCVSGSSNRK